MSTVGRHMSSFLTYILELSSALHSSFIIKINNTENLHSTLYCTKYIHILYHMQSSKRLLGKESKGHRLKQLAQSQRTITGDAGTETMSSASIT